MAGQSAGLSSTSFTVCFVKLEVSQWIACLTNWRFYPGFVKLNWFMLDKPLGFQWFCQAKFRSNAGYGPIYSISAWQTDDSIPDLSSYIGSCLTNWCVFSGFVKHITAHTHFCLSFPWLTLRFVKQVTPHTHFCLSFPASRSRFDKQTTPQASPS